MVKYLEKKWLEDILKLLIGLTMLITINILGEQYFFRIDLTEENRYTIKDATKEILKNLDDRVYVDVYLEGDLNSSFRRFQKSVRETLEEFALYSDRKVIYNFIDPETAKSEAGRNEFRRDLASRGIQPTNIIDTRDGKRVEKIIFPGAIISYAGVEKGVMLLQGLQGEQQINSSIQNIEYNLISTIHQLTGTNRKKIAFLQGYGEAKSSEIISIQNELFNFYQIEEIDIRNTEELKEIDLAIIARPTKKWSELDKIKLDQYIVKGGNALFLIDRTDANMDSANFEMNLSFPIETNLEDMLFRYGTRVNPDLVQDNNAAMYPIVIGEVNNEANIVNIPWPYYPVINNFGDHPISKDLNAVLGRFVSSVDTVKAEGIKKTALLMTSEYSRTVSTPARISVADLRKNLNPESLNKANIPVAWLLEGSFTSIYKNRFLPKGFKQSDFVDKDSEGRVVVIGDGNFIINDLNPNTGEPLPLGTFQFQPRINYGNQDFLLNTVAYLADADGIITARNKEILIRPLDKVQIVNEKTYWQFINLVIPVIIIILLGVALKRYRKARYANNGKDE